MRNTTDARKRLSKRYSSSKQVTIRIQNEGGDMKSYTAKVISPTKLNEMIEEPTNSSEIHVSDLNPKLKK